MFTRKRIWITVCTVGAVLTTAAGISPGEAVSNLAQWAELARLPELAQWLSEGSADQWVSMIGVAAIVFSVSMMARPKLAAIYGNARSAGALQLLSLVVLLLASYWQFGTRENLIRELNQLRAGSEAQLQFHKPNWKKQTNGEWNVRGWFVIASKFARTGLVIGVSSDQQFSAKVGNNGVMIGGEYSNPNAWTELGTYRFYIQNPTGAYFVDLMMVAPADVVIKYVFEGEREGPIVTWQAPKS